ncbi:hypothetical protein Mapa_000761 [Marchantia paleacea]|nr:hypothetical protein Mapa_000761 [Marchantia paleacea]
MAAIRCCVDVFLLAPVALVFSANPSLSTKNVKAPFVVLKHLDYHEDSPLHDAHTTFTERIHKSVRRSQARASAFRTIGAAGVTPRGKHFDSTVEVSSKAGSGFQSPVSAAPGAYIMSISLGSPPQRRTAIVDTGSDLVWLQCARAQSASTSLILSSTLANQPLSEESGTSAPYVASFLRSCTTAGSALTAMAMGISPPRRAILLSRL